MRIQKKSPCVVFENIPFHTLLINGNIPPPTHQLPPALNQGGRFDFLEFFRKKGRVGKIGGVLRNGNL